MTLSNATLCPGDALIVVDVQNDFCPGGALAIEEGDKVVPVLNHWIESATAHNVPVYVSRDWHPVDHISFEQRGGPWPPHCIQDSDGAGFHPDLRVPESAVKVTKGVRFDQDQNSAFDQTGLAEQLRHDGVKRLFVGGLAEDVCVLATVLDGCKEGFEVVLIPDATRPVTIPAGEEARRKMHAAGAHLEAAD
ncbi:isochorismatase family protein [Marinobacter changyiensis]|uniref:isochorismatase family protein n=1 Tax=Marinobacter changyiensis TaxID=2604091 RepID=UPI0012650660|nr:isochorismatase family protein [Marinobacter changyiensis]